MSSMEEKKRRVLGANKGRKILAGHDMYEDLFKEDIQGYILIG